MSRLQTEIALLERELSRLQTTDVKTRPRQLFQDGSSSIAQTSGPNISPLGTPEQRRKLRFATPDEINEPDRFVTHRKKSKQPVTSTPRQDTSETPGAAKTSLKHSGAKLKPATFDGTGNWLDYKAHFEACSKLNGWTYEEKGLYLAICLRGQAQGVFGNLSGDKNDFNELSKSLEERFAPPNQTELYRVQLRERRQKPSETLSELGQDIRRLVNLAYPTAPNDVRETLAKEQFMDALINSDMRIRVKQARPVNLNDAVRHAVELEAYNKAERKHIENQGFIHATGKDDKMSETFNESMKSLQKTVDQLAKSVQTLESNQNRFRQRPQRNNNFSNAERQRGYPKKKEVRKCFNCSSEDHLIRNCPKLQPTPEKQKQSSNTIGSGLVADVKFNGLQSDCLIDTGASLSIISLRLWDRHIEFSNKNRLEPYESKVYTASNNALDIRGKTKVFIEIQGIKCVWNVVVANINIDAILGLDFLKAKHCQIDAVSDTLIIQGKKCKLRLSERIGCMSSFTYFQKSDIQIKEHKLSDVLCDVGRCRSIQKNVTHRKSNKLVQTGAYGIFSGQIIDKVKESKSSLNERVGTRRRHELSNDDKSELPMTSIKGPEVKSLLGKEQTRKFEKFEDHTLLCASKRYLCKICQRTFKKAKYLSRHRKLKHSDMDDKDVWDLSIPENVMKQGGSLSRDEKKAGRLKGGFRSIRNNEAIEENNSDGDTVWIASDKFTERTPNETEENHGSTYETVLQNNDRLTRNFEICRFKVSKSKIWL